MEKSASDCGKPVENFTNVVKFTTGLHVKITTLLPVKNKKEVENQKIVCIIRYEATPQRKSGGVALKRKERNDYKSTKIRKYKCRSIKHV